MTVTDESFLEAEREIVWLEDPLRYPYLREGSYGTLKPSQFPSRNWNRGHENELKIVGYAVHRPAGKRFHFYKRRFWFLKRYDRGSWGAPHPNYASGKVFPAEAVIPSSILVGRESKLV